MNTNKNAVTKNLFMIQALVVEYYLSGEDYCVVYYPGEVAGVVALHLFYHLQVPVLRGGVAVAPVHPVDEADEVIRRYLAGPCVRASSGVRPATTLGSQVERRQLQTEPQQPGLAGGDGCRVGSGQVT